MKKTMESAFEQFRMALLSEEQTRLRAFFDSFDRHCTLSRTDKTALRRDFERAILYYASVGVSLDTALRRMDPERLGGFYARPAVVWYRLDDAAKVYPLSMAHGQMAVFRLSVYLKAPVVPELLQMALTFTIRRFPGFATTVKKGFFWHYLDATKCRYAIEPEREIPCQPLKVAASGSYSFRVLYYQNRISAEYFHILTDGTGGLTFLKTLTAEYLRLQSGMEAPAGSGILTLAEAPTAGETANEFPRADQTQKTSGFVDKAALQMGGELTRHKPCRVLHFKMNAWQLKAAADRYQTTVTAYTLGLMFLACRSAIDELDGDVKIQVPVNMRKFYPSATLRNFSMYCTICLNINAITTLPDILDEITRQLKEKAARDAMSEMMNATEKLVTMLRFIPLAVKAPVAHVVYGFLGDKVLTNTLSNLGVVTWPEELASCVDSMDFVLGTAITNRASCSMVTCGDIATLSIAKLTVDPSFEETMYRLLTADDIQTRVEGSELYAH